MTHFKKVLLISLMASCVALAACEPKGPAEKAGEKIDNTVDKTKDAVEEAGDNIRDAADDTADAVKDATN